MGSAVYNKQVEFVLLIGQFLQEALDEIHGNGPRDPLMTVIHVDRLMERYDHSKPFSVVPFAEVAVAYMRDIGAPITAQRLQDWAIGSVIVESLEDDKED